MTLIYTHKIKPYYTKNLYILWLAAVCLNIHLAQIRLLKGMPPHYIKPDKHGSSCVTFLKWVLEEIISIASLQHYDDPRKSVYWKAMINSS